MNAQALAVLRCSEGTGVRQTGPRPSLNAEGVRWTEVLGMCPSWEVSRRPCVVGVQILLFKGTPSFREARTLEHLYRQSSLLPVVLRVDREAIGRKTDSDTQLSGKRDERTH